MDSHNLRKAALRLKNYWLNLSHNDVYDLGKYGIFSSGRKLFSNTGHRSALFENDPLKFFLDPKIDYEGIHNKSRDIDNPTYLNIHAYSYNTSENIIFTNWKTKRSPHTKHTKINIDHIMASSALPYIFPSKNIEGEMFGDGGLQLESPSSIMIKQGCDKILGISLDNADNKKESVAEHLFCAIFPDAIEKDFKKINEINKKIQTYPQQERNKKQIQTLLIRPSKEKYSNKEGLINTLPRTLNYFAKIMGLHDNPDSNIINYLVFTREYTEYLIQQGYDDAINQKEIIKRFIES
jgi:NTE family protein